MEKAYVYKNRNDILMKSSSGGAFWAIAESFFTSQGYCYGARYDSSFRVVHSDVDSLEMCTIFQGSKYVQSDITKCFTKIEKQLAEGARILFTGTPCQIAAVKHYLETKKIDMTNLYSVDIVCHGVPSPSVWHDFVEHLKSKEHSNLKNFSFRYKPYGWKGYPIYAEFENGKKYVNTMNVSSYQNLFRKNLLIRQSCFNCPYPGKYQSDLTIGDFWGIELCMPEISVKNGVSLIVVHTNKGNDIIAKMNKLDVILKEVMDDKYKKYNHNLISATKCPDAYEKFWDDYENKGIDYVLYKYGDDNFRGKVMFYTKNFLRRTGLADKIKKKIGRA